MKRYRRPHLFWTLLVSAIIIGGLTPRQAVAAWTVGTPIVTWWAQGALNDQVAHLAVNGHVNLVGVSSMDEVNLAKQHGLRTQLYNDWLLTPAALDGGSRQAQLDALINQYKASPAAYSYYITDEPWPWDFATYSPLVSYVRQRDPNHMAYSNLLPNYAIGNEATYRSYIDQYVAAMQPSILSYDHYQLMQTGDTSGYLQNLATIRQKATQYGLPFMNIVQACQWDSSWRNPNPDELRFLVYSTLAYGAQGISYFYYKNQRGTPDPGGIVDYNNAPTATYTALTPLNKEFKNIAAQYQRLKVIGTYLKGYLSNAMPPGTTALPANAPFYISSGVATNMEYVDGDPLRGILFGFFDADGTTVTDATFALVTNLNYSTALSVTVRGPANQNLSVFDAATGAWTPTGHPWAMLTLPPGGGALVGLTSAVAEPSTVVLLGTGLAVLLVCAWRRQRSLRT